jgi:hypothetical protein
VSFTKPRCNFGSWLVCFGNMRSWCLVYRRLGFPRDGDAQKKNWMLNLPCRRWELWKALWPRWHRFFDSFIGTAVSTDRGGSNTTGCLISYSYGRTVFFAEFSSNRCCTRRAKLAILGCAIRVEHPVTFDSTQFSGCKWAGIILLSEDESTVYLGV